MAEEARTPAPKRPVAHDLRDMQATQGPRSGRYTHDPIPSKGNGVVSYPPRGDEGSEEE